MPKESIIIRSPFNTPYHDRGEVHAEVESHVLIGKPLLTINIGGRRPARVTMLLDEAKRFATMIFGMSEELAEKEAPNQIEIMPGDLVKVFGINYGGEVYEHRGYFDGNTHKVSRTRSTKEGHVRLIGAPGVRSQDYKLDMISFHSRPAAKKKE